MKVNIQRIPILVCPLCKAKVDGLDFKPLSKAKCPACGGSVDIPGAFENYLLHERLRFEPNSVKFRAFDQTLERAVTVRILNPQSDPKLLRGILTTNRKLSALNHTNIALVHRVDEFDEVQFIEGELLPSGSLRDLNRSSEFPSEIESLAIIRDIADGLCSAHKEGVYHLNLHPGLIRFDSSGTPKIIDFSDYRLEEKARKLIGQPNYVSPESVLYAAGVKGMPRPDGRADIFSLGVILYELLTQTPPYGSPEEHDNMSIIRNRFSALPEPVTVYRELDEATSIIVDRMMAPNLEERYANMAEVAAYLDDQVQMLIERMGPMYDSHDGSVIDMRKKQHDVPYAEDSRAFDAGEQTLSEALKSVIMDVNVDPSATVVMKPGVPLDQEEEDIEDEGELSRVNWPDEMLESDERSATAEPEAIDLQKQADLSDLGDLSSHIEPAAAADTAELYGVSSSRLPSINSRTASRQKTSSRTSSADDTAHRTASRTQQRRDERATPLFPLVGGIIFGLFASIMAVIMLNRPDDLSTLDIPYAVGADPIPVVHQHETQVATSADLNKQAATSQYLPGLYYNYFRNSQAKFIGGKPPEDTGQLRTISLRNIKAFSQGELALDVTGFLKIPQDGVYEFKFWMNGGGSVSIAKRNFKLKKKKQYEAKQKLRLKKGFHPVRITYRQKNGARSLSANWSGPGFNGQMIPMENLFHPNPAYAKTKHAQQEIGAPASQPKNLLPGIRYSYFPLIGKPLAPAAKPSHQGIVKSFDLNEIKGTDQPHFALRYQGQFYASKTGDYVFQINSTPPGNFVLGKHQFERKRGLNRRILTLKAGHYPFRLDYRTGDKPPALKVSVREPDSKKFKLISTPSLFHKSNINSTPSTISPDVSSETYEQPLPHGPAIYAVNYGGPAYEAVDGTKYIAGPTSNPSLVINKVRQEVAGTEDQTLYQTMVLLREEDGIREKVNNLEPGKYILRLSFTEIRPTYSRTANLLIEGKTAIANLNLSKAGTDTAYDVWHSFKFKGGQLNVKLERIKLDPILSAFTLYKPADN